MFQEVEDYKCEGTTAMSIMPLSGYPALNTFRFKSLYSCSDINLPNTDFKSSRTLLTSSILLTVCLFNKLLHGAEQCGQKRRTSDLFLCPPMILAQETKRERRLSATEKKFKLLHCLEVTEIPCSFWEWLQGISLEVLLKKILM